MRKYLFILLLCFMLAGCATTEPNTQPNNNPFPQLDPRDFLTENITIDKTT